MITFFSLHLICFYFCSLYDAHYVYSGLVFSTFFFSYLHKTCICTSAAVTLQFRCVGSRKFMLSFLENNSLLLFFYAGKICKISMPFSLWNSKEEAILLFGTCTSYCRIKALQMWVKYFKCNFFFKMLKEESVLFCIY